MSSKSGKKLSSKQRRCRAKTRNRLRRHKREQHVHHWPVQPGYAEFDTAVRMFIRSYLQHINPASRMVGRANTHQQFTDLCTIKHMVHNAEVILQVERVKFDGDVASVLAYVYGPQTKPYVYHARFLRSMSDPLFFDYLVGYLDRLNVIYWRKISDPQEGANFRPYDGTRANVCTSRPLLYHMHQLWPHTVVDLERACLSVGDSVLSIKNGYVLTNGRPLATLNMVVRTFNDRGCDFDPRFLWYMEDLCSGKKHESALSAQSLDQGESIITA